MSLTDVIKTGKLEDISYALCIEMSKKQVLGMLKSTTEVKIGLAKGENQNIVDSHLSKSYKDC